MALTTLTALKTHLGVTGTSQDAFLTQLLTAVQACFLRLIDRQLEATNYTDYYSGNGTAVLRLREYPVIAVTSVHLDAGGFWGQAPDAFATVTGLVQGTDYALVLDNRDAGGGTGRLYRITGVWPGRWRSKAGLLTPVLAPGAGNIKVVYRAGYETIPADVALAIWQVCARLKADRAYGRPAEAESYEEYAIRFAVGAEKAWLMGTESQIVARYKRLTSRHEVLS